MKFILRCMDIAWQAIASLAQLHFSRIIQATLYVNLIIGLNATCLYYFYDFSGGASHAPFWVRGIDESVVVLSALAVVLAFLRDHGLRAPFPFEQWSAASKAVAVFIVINATVAIAFTVSEATAPLAYRIAKSFLFVSWIGALVLALPRERLMPTIATCGFLVFASSIVQIAFSLLVTNLAPGIALWRDDPIQGYTPLTGFIINPNRFGLLVNLALCVSLAMLYATRRIREWLLFGSIAAFLAWAVVRTGSLSQVVVAFGVLIYAVILLVAKRSRSFVPAIGALVVSAGLLYLFPGPFHRSSSKIDRNSVIADLQERISSGRNDAARPGSVATLRFELGKIDEDIESDSIATRIDDLRKVARQFSDGDPPKLYFGNLLFRKHVHAHGDFWLIFLEAGLVGFGLFLGPILLALYCSLRLFWSANKMDGASQAAFGVNLGIAAFCATFLVDNMTYDSPTGLLLVLSVAFGLAALRMSRSVGPHA